VLLAALRDLPFFLARLVIAYDGLSNATLCALSANHHFVILSVFDEKKKRRALTHRFSHQKHWAHSTPSTAEIQDTH
jgi:hypothetical protein